MPRSRSGPANVKRVSSDSTDSAGGGGEMSESAVFLAMDLLMAGASPWSPVKADM